MKNKTKLFLKTQAKAYTLGLKTKANAKTIIVVIEDTQGQGHLAMTATLSVCHLIEMLEQTRGMCSDE